MTDEEIIGTVRRRYRICNYLFRLGLGWLGIGVAARSLQVDLGSWGFPNDALEPIGFAIITAALALTFAIYRCPACDRYLSRFRRDKKHCANCGVRANSTPPGRPMERR